MRTGRVLFFLVAFVLLVILAACRDTNQAATPQAGDPASPEGATTPVGEAPALEEEVETVGGGVQATPAQNAVPPTPFLSGNLLQTVPSHPSQPTPANARPWFDIFSWQSFIALNWPADPNNPGQALEPNNPARFNNFQDSPGPVWSTWMTSYDLFPGPNATPPAWGESSYGRICPNLPPPSDGAPPVFLADRTSKFDSHAHPAADEFLEAFAGPLPDQTGQWTMYAVFVNEVEYTYVRDNGYYDQARWPIVGSSPTPDALPPRAVVLPPVNSDIVDPAVFTNSIEIKTAWRQVMTDTPGLDRFYTLDAAMVIPESCRQQPGEATAQCECEMQKLALVGFHIAQKVPHFKQWVWSTFEHVNNVVPMGEGIPASYYNPEGAPTVTPGGQNGNNQGFSYAPDPTAVVTPEPVTPVNVMRQNPIPTTPEDYSTVDLNVMYQMLVRGTVWENYELVMTQWPTNEDAPGHPNSFCQSSDQTQSISPGAPFPVCGVANTTMETYLQTQSCMDCHSGALPADFSYILFNRSIPVPTYTPTP